ncbi:MAG TPA: hypothetical protein VMA75_03945 [Candidatus Paceibacterota bacterium]|nr:hypothetical protein [Candidatus Paceibacterota bacterium]
MEEQKVLRAILEEYRTEQGNGVTEVRGGIGKKRIQVSINAAHSHRSNRFADVRKGTKRLEKRLKKAFPDRKIQAVIWSNENKRSRPKVNTIKGSRVIMITAPIDL